MATAVGDVFGLQIRGACNGQRIINQLWYQVSAVNGGVGESTAANSLINAVRSGAGGQDIMETKFLACNSTSYVLESWVAQRVWPVRMVYQIQDRNLAGTLVDPVNKQNTSWVFTKYTDFGGRSGIGSFHGVLPDSQASSGELDALYTPTLETFGQTLLAQLIDVANGLTFLPIIWHKDGQGQAQTKILRNVALRTSARVMRRRTVRVGV